MRPLVQRVTTSASRAPSGDRMNDPFTTLGIEATYDVDLPALERRVRAISSAVHPDKHAGASPGERRAALSKAVEVNEAFRTLRDPLRRADALLARLGAAPPEGREPPATHALLLEALEWREELAETRARGDAAALGRLSARARERFAKTERALSGDFARAARGELDRSALAALVGELRFCRRFLDEVEAAEDEAQS